MNNWVHPTLVTVLIRKIVAAPGAHNVPSVNPRVTAVAEKRVASLTWRLILSPRIDRTMATVPMERILDSRCVTIMTKVKVCLGPRMCFCMNASTVAW